jgi:hypothetical protein
MNEIGISSSMSRRAIRRAPVSGLSFALSLWLLACGGDSVAVGSKPQKKPQAEQVIADAGGQGDSGTVHESSVGADGAIAAQASSDAGQANAEAGLDASESDRELALGSDVYPADMHAGCPLFLERIEAGERESWAIAELLDVDEEHLTDQLYDEQLLQSVVDACTGVTPSLDDRRRAQLFQVMLPGPWENEPWARCASDLLEMPETLPELARVLGHSESDVLAIMDRLGIDVPALRSALKRKSADYESLSEFTRVMRDTFLSSLAGSIASFSDAPFYDLPGVAFAEDEGSGVWWELQVEQPYDHADPKSEMFIQRIWMQFVGIDAPTVFVVNGPESQSAGSPVDRWLKANVILVSNRFAPHHLAQSPEASWPKDNSLWRFNTTEQTAADIHRVIEMLEPALHGPWLTVGDFRGAGTALVHRRLFPDDVAGTIAFNPTLGSEDPELGVAFIASDVREELRWVPEVRDALLATLPTLAEGEEPDFCARDTDPELIWAGAGYFEWSVWASPAGCTPTTRITAEEALQLGASRWAQRAPSDAAARHAELGEWGHYETTVANARERLMEARVAMGLPEETPRATPWATEPSYDPSNLQATADWVATEGHDLLFLYQAGDPRGAWPVDLGAAENSLSVILESAARCGGSAPEEADAETRRAMRELIESWVGPEYVYAESFDGRVPAAAPEPAPSDMPTERGIDCEDACAAAAVEDCGDSENCEADMCSILDVAPECAAEANAYLGCMATVDPEASFECAEGRTYFISDACNEPFYDAWQACTNP